METKKEACLNIGQEIKTEPKQQQQSKLPNFTFVFELNENDKIELKTIDVEAGTINAAFQTAIKAVEGKNWKLIKTY